jgi:hypothetical protein
MVRIYIRPNSSNRPRKAGRPFGSFDELFDLLLNELTNSPGFGPAYGTSFTQRGEPVPESPHSCLMSEGFRDRIRPQKGRPSTQSCSSCGIKFSANLMINGVCHNCSSGGKGKSEEGSSQGRGLRPPVSDKTLKQAYGVLGCDEKDSDEMVKRRHRELAKEFHADRISPGASCEKVNYANERFCKTQEAYEIIMITRKKIT